ncbi:MAG TPA: hypothetical protein V6C89_15000 [Drouetiella sp.]
MDTNCCSTRQSKSNYGVGTLTIVLCLILLGVILHGRLNHSGDARTIIDARPPALSFH